MPVGAMLAAVVAGMLAGVTCVATVDSLRRGQTDAIIGGVLTGGLIVVAAIMTRFAV